MKANTKTADNESKSIQFLLHLNCKQKQQHKELPSPNRCDANHCSITCHTTGMHWPLIFGLDDV